MPAVDSGRLRVFHGSQFAPEALVEAKDGRFVSLCLPARDEAATIGPIVDAVVGHLVDTVALVDEVLVVDDGSTDATARVAADAGAIVVAADRVLPGCGPGQGKGEALWKALAASKGDLLAFCDADLREFDPAFVTGVLGPLLVDPAIGFVKGFYDRPIDGVAGAGGRATELVARPLLALLFPGLAGVVQPLAGEFAARRTVLEQVPFVHGYGVDLGLLLDVTTRFGVDALAQVDLGTRTHRNRPLDQLATQALAVMRTALDRAGVDLGPNGPLSVDLGPNGPLSGVRSPDGVSSLERRAREPLQVDASQRPPIVEVEAYRRPG
ncbi:MAG: glucosyl-3-phosphoglycerate synthase [Acidimicrobiales bacterium]